ncbi:MAG TPA: VOC family protein [Ktedonobacterales bacterium]|jgi:catechol 2,3-dioxygenase|nr:VOC family protein [Ktedonobacterales bacterium]
MTTPDQQTRDTATASHTSIDPATQVGLVSLTVANLDRSLTYYTEALGFVLLHREGQTAILGAGDAPLLTLTELPGAAYWPGRNTGLYHFAILLPSRLDLARSLIHMLEYGLPFPGQSDHNVSEALYLTDPDGNGIEIYRDRPRSEWRWNGDSVHMTIDPLDVRAILAEAAAQPAPWTGLPAGTRLGHMHLQVGNIQQAADFYAGVLGFDITAQMPGALFVSAGGYHHHLGLNTWQSRGAGPAPAGTAGLRFFTLELSSEEARAAVVERVRAAGLEATEMDGAIAVRDPWNNVVLLGIGPASDAQTIARLNAAQS